MKRIWTIIGVGDVPGSLRWYQSLFGQPEVPPSHDYFGQILDTDGTVLLCVHRWGAHEHPSLTSPDEAAAGNGLLLFFRVDDYEMALTRARTLVDRFEQEPHVNPNTHTHEFSLRDPDGYYVTISDARCAMIGSNRMAAFVIICPYCGEALEISIEEDVRGSFVQYCEVCCNPCSCVAGRRGARCEWSCTGPRS